MGFHETSNSGKGNMRAGGPGDLIETHWLDKTAPHNNLEEGASRCAATCPSIV